MKNTLFLLLICLPVLVNAQGEAAWNKEFQKLESQYHYGKYYQCTNIGKSLLKKIRKKGINPALETPTQALLLKYQAAIGLRLGNDSLLDDLFNKWNQNETSISDSISIMGSIALSGVAFVYNKYEKAEYYLTVAETQIDSINDPDGFWNQQIRIAKMELFMQTLSFNAAVANIEPSIKYQEQLMNQSTKRIFSLGKNEEDFIKKREYKDRFNTLGYLKVLRGDIYREKGDLDKADSIYSFNHREMESWKSNNEESYLLNEFGHTQLKVLQGDIIAGLSLKKIKNKFAQNIKFSIPNIQYNYMYEQELMVDLQLNNFSKHANGVQRYQREITKNYSAKSTFQFSTKHLLQIADLYKGKYKSYEKNLYKQTIDLRKFYGVNDAKQVDFLNDLAYGQVKIYDFENAERTLLNIITILEQNNSKSSPICQQAYLELGAFYANNTNKFIEADSIFDRYFSSFVVKELHEYHPQYSKFLGDYALIDRKRDLFSKSLGKYKKLVTISTRKFGDLSEENALALEQMAQVQMDLGYFPDAEKNLLKSALAFKTLKKTKSLSYVYTLKTLGEVYRINGDYSNSKRKLLEAYESSKKFTDINPMLIVNIDEDLAQLNIELGNYYLAEDLLYNIQEQKTLSYGDNHIELIKTNQLIGQLFLHQGRLIEAEKHFKKATRICAENFGTNSFKYLLNKSELIEVYYQIGDLERANKLCSEIINSYKLKFGSSYLRIADILIKKTKIELELNYPNNDLLKNLKKATNIITNNVGDRHPKIAEVIELRAEILLKQGKLKIALIQFQAANLIFSSSYGDEHTKTADNQVKIASLYYQTGNYDNALAFYNRALKIYEYIFDSRHPKYIYTLGKIGRTKFVQGDRAESIDILRKTTQMNLNFINDNFPSLSNYEKEKYWNKVNEDFDVFNSIAIQYYKTDPSVLVDIYNNRLATKALLMNNSLIVTKHIQDYGDEEDIQKLNSLRQLRDSLSWAQSYSMAELDSFNYNIQQTRETITQIEKQLSERAEKTINHANSRPPNWVAVKSALLPNEAAMEIVRIRGFNSDFTDSVFYVALIIKKETKNRPDVVVLKNGKELETKHFSYYNNTIKQRHPDTKSYGEYWEYFDAYLKNKTTIYLSADGVYNQINPETFKNNKGNYLIDRYTFYNISNTRELVEKSVAMDYTSKTAVLFGNPRFNMTSNDSSSISPPLPGAEKEVINLNKYIRSRDWSSIVYTGNSATESLVKNLDNPRILHLATHGYFMENSTTSSQPNRLLSKRIHNSQLLRSGLLFAGGDSLLELNDITKINKSDGVLTALEAMNLNLNQTELVFLSACETGRGDILSGEGIFGLQEAFKVAGAQNIIMTLFKVDDKITQELVQKFYSNWLKTGNKRLAFTQAKKAILKKYKDPIYWGSFVMIGLD